MPDPLTFPTEQARLKAREQFCHTANAIWSGDAQEMPNFYAEQFDSRFPPIAPPKMVPWEAWVLVDADGQSRGHLRRMRHLVAERCATGERVARVRVVEVDDE